MTFETFEPELSRLVTAFTRQFDDLTSPGYAEAQLRDDFLNPFFRALGWDLENKAGHIQNEREVEIESRTDIAGKAKRADYLFRTDGNERFICEAKKPRERLGPKHAFQAKRYAWNMTLPLAVLSDFEEIKIYVVGGKPHVDRPDEGLWKTWHFKEFPAVAREIWDLLSRPSVAAGSIDALLDSLPKRAPSGRGKAKQLYLIKPDRTRSLDTEFLGFLDEARRSLGSDLVKHNPDADIRDVSRLTEAVQHILDRLLFLRICEDRDIDTGMRLDSIVQTWRRSYGRDDTKRYGQTSMFDGDVAGKSSGSSTFGESRDSLWYAIVRHFRALDRRPASHVPFFNGQLFKAHFTETLHVGDQWLCDFIGELSDDESVYLFNVIEVEMLGSVYERFLGKIVRPHGRGVTIEEKPEVRKAGGVYYTPRYIVDYIVEQTVGRLLDPILEFKTFAAFEKQTNALNLLDPACGSGSFLIRCFERVCEHWQRRLTRVPDERRKELCWVDPVTHDVHLTVELKRQILRNNIYGVDIDAQAVEVTQLSLYLKMLENENRTTLERQRELFSKDIALLPSLENNIKCGNSLIASDFSLDPDDLVRVRAFDWPVQFREIMKGGGFDAVVGNPPYVQIENIPTEDRDYYKMAYGEDGKLGKRYDLYQIFVMRGVGLLRRHGRFGNIIPNTFLMGHSYELLRKRMLQNGKISEIVDLPQGVFIGVTVDNVLLFFNRDASDLNDDQIEINKLDPKSEKSRVARRDWDETFQIPLKAIKADDGYKINVHTNPQQANLFKKIESGGIRLGDVTESSQGIILYKTQDDAAASNYTGFQERIGWKRLLRGKNIARYETLWGGEHVSYGEWLWCARDEKFFNQEKILLHAMRNKSLARRLVGTLDAEHHYNAHNLANIIAKKDGFYSLKFILGIFNSNLINYWYRAHFPNVNINPSDFRQIPIPRLDFSSRKDGSVHDKLVDLVDKMLTLTPKLRAAATDKERAILQNAVTATDQQIDQLVYELYGLTPEEIALVEGEAQA